MAGTIRCDIIEMICTAQAGHPGGSLSAADIVTALYFRVMRIDPRNPSWPDRDRFILSKGHACPVWYSALAERGYFDKRHLATLRRLDSILQGHPDMRKTPGIDMTAGSLGHGLSVGLGMALGGRLQGRDYHVWVVLGDGEVQEGSVWEAAMAAPRWNLGNLTAIVDCNRLQNDGYVQDIMPAGSLADKWRAFGWTAREIDGNDMAEVVRALEEARAGSTAPVRAGTMAPVCIIAHTVKGKGVSYMEDVAAWHGRAPCLEEAELALDEIRRACAG
ncbi:MAG: transketolase [Anaerolineae bacterium]|nr:transketolase [Anaerolineae bacterium]